MNSEVQNSAKLLWKNRRILSRKKGAINLTEKINMLEYENKYYSKGCKIIAGVDEAGRGPLAGPVVAAAVVFDKNT